MIVNVTNCFNAASVLARIHTLVVETSGLFGTFVVACTLGTTFNIWVAAIRWSASASAVVTFSVDTTSA